MYDISDRLPSHGVSVRRHYAIRRAK